MSIISKRKFIYSKNINITKSVFFSNPRNNKINTTTIGYNILQALVVVDTDIINKKH